MTLKHHELFSKKNENGLTLLEQTNLETHLKNLNPNRNPLHKTRWENWLVKNDMPKVNNRSVHTFVPLQSCITSGMGDKALDNLTTNITNWLGAASAQHVQALGALENNHSVVQPFPYHDAFHTEMIGRLIVIMSQINLNISFLIDNGHLMPWQMATHFVEEDRLRRLADQNAIVTSLLKSLEAYRALHLRYMDLKVKGSNVKSVAKHIQILRGDMPVTSTLQEKTTQRRMTPQDVPWHEQNVNKLKDSILKHSSNQTDELTKCHKLIRELMRNNGTLKPDSPWRRFASTFISDPKLRQKNHLDAFKDSSKPF